MSTPLLSVCLQTYQHAPFINRCIESILNQQTTFEFELIIGEDGSTDGTREICINYKNKFPDKIKLFLRDRKDVIYINGKPSGRFNFIENLKSASGKYIALIDGDDYWTDNNKLQDQITYLELNQDFSMCFNNVRLVDKNNKIIRDSILNYLNDEFTHDTLVTKISPPTLTTVFRKDALPKLFPLTFYQVTNADMFLKGLISLKGKIKFINKITASKCIHPNGIYAGTSSIVKLENKVKTYHAMLEYFESQIVKSNLKKAMSLDYIKLLYNYARHREFANFSRVFIMLFRFCFANRLFPPFWLLFYKMKKSKIADY